MSFERGILIQRGVIKAIAGFLLGFLFLFLISLFPRNVTFEAEGNAHTPVMNYEFSWTEYKNNITGYIQYIMDEKSLGPTKHDNFSTEEAIGRYVPRSLPVIACGFLISIAVGVTKGIYDFKRHSQKSFFGKQMTSIWLAVPDFVILLTLMWLMRSYAPVVKIFGFEEWYSFIIPSMFVAIFPSAYLAKIVSASFLSIEKELYVTAAKAKGFTENAVIYKHMFKNSLLTIINYLPVLMALVLSNLLMVEYLLGYQGAAYRLLEALGGRIQVIQVGGNIVIENGLIIGFGSFFLLLVFIAQLIKVWTISRIQPKT